MAERGVGGKGNWPLPLTSRPGSDSGIRGREAVEGGGEAGGGVGWGELAMEGRWMAWAKGVEERWRALSEEVLVGFREWRDRHPKATLVEIEAALDERWAAARARMLA